MDQLAETAAAPWVKRRRFDVAEYHRMVAAEVLHEDDPVELIEGEIIEMSPANTPHRGAVMALTMRLAVASSDRFILSVQTGLHLDGHNEPEPDLVLLRARADGYRHEPPPSAGDAVLVIEVADSSLRFDRTVKLPLYARHAIPEYWIVDVSAGVIEVFRGPEQDRYAETIRAARGDHIAPLSLPECRIAVAEVVPDLDRLG